MGGRSKALLGAQGPRPGWGAGAKSCWGSRDLDPGGGGGGVQGESPAGGSRDIDPGGGGVQGQSPAGRSRGYLGHGGVQGLSPAGVSRGLDPGGGGVQGLSPAGVSRGRDPGGVQEQSPSGGSRGRLDPGGVQGVQVGKVTQPRTNITSTILKTLWGPASPGSPAKE